MSQLMFITLKAFLETRRLACERPTSATILFIPFSSGSLSRASITLENTFLQIKKTTKDNYHFMLIKKYNNNKTLLT